MMDELHCGNSKEKGNIPMKNFRIHSHFTYNHSSAHKLGL